MEYLFRPRRRTLGMKSILREQKQKHRYKASARKSVRFGSTARGRAEHDEHAAQRHNHFTNQELSTCIDHLNSLTEEIELLQNMMDEDVNFTQASVRARGQSLRTLYSSTRKTLDGTLANGRPDPRRLIGQLPSQTDLDMVSRTRPRQPRLDTDAASKKQRTRRRIKDGGVNNLSGYRRDDPELTDTEPPERREAGVTSSGASTQGTSYSSTRYAESSYTPPYTSNHNVSQPSRSTSIDKAKRPPVRPALNVLPLPPSYAPSIHPSQALQHSMYDPSRMAVRTQTEYSTSSTASAGTQYSARRPVSVYLDLTRHHNEALRLSEYEPGHRASSRAPRT